MTAFTEKPSEIGKQEWLEKLENVHLPRTNMNRLVMNYLVTGKIIFPCPCVNVVLHNQIVFAQRVSKKLLKNLH